MGRRGSVVGPRESGLEEDGPKTRSSRRDKEAVPTGRRGSVAGQGASAALSSTKSTSERDGDLGESFGSSQSVGKRSSNKSEGAASMHGRASVHGRASAKGRASVKHQQSTEMRASEVSAGPGFHGARPEMRGKGMMRSMGSQLDVAFNQDEEDKLMEESLSWYELRGCLQLTGIVCRRRCRQLRKAVGQGLRKELNDTVLSTTTVKSMLATKRMKREEARGVVLQWFQKQWETLFGRAQQGVLGRKGSLYKSTAEIVSKSMVEGGFGVSSFIIHNTLGTDINAFFDLSNSKEIGAGGSARVYRAVEHSTKVERAIKCIAKKNPSEFMRLLQEVSVMKVLDHPNVVKLFETFEDDRYLYIVLELCNGGDLLELLMDRGHLGELQTAVVIRTVLMVLNYLHTNKFVHRDIKPENVLFKESGRFDSMSIRLADFGFSCKMPGKGSEMCTKVGSPYYVAPEVLEGHYSQAVDLWSTGAVCYLMLVGYPPFAGNSDAATLALVRKGEFVFHEQYWRGITHDAKHLIRHLMQVDPSQRLNVQKALDHPWIKNRGRATVERIGEATVDRLITFHHHHQLRKAAMLAVAYQLESRELAQLRELFHGLDANGDGIVTRMEFEESMKACRVDEAFIHEMLPSVDADGSGIIDYTEFVAATLETAMYIKNHAACFRAFRSFDQDDSGGLDQEEVAETIDMTRPEDQAEVAAFFGEVDENGDGIMDYGEFYKMLAKELDPHRERLGADEEEEMPEREQVEEAEEEVAEKAGSGSGSDSGSGSGSGSDSGSERDGEDEVDEDDEEENKGEGEEEEEGDAAESEGKAEDASSAEEGSSGNVNGSSGNANGTANTGNGDGNGSSRNGNGNGGRSGRFSATTTGLGMSATGLDSSAGKSGTDSVGDLSAGQAAAGSEIRFTANTNESISGRGSPGRPSPGRALQQVVEDDEDDEDDEDEDLESGRSQKS